MDPKACASHAFSDDDCKVLISRALESERRAVEQLVNFLTPVIRQRAGRVLARGARGRNLQAAIDDVVQLVLISLFADRCRALCSWDAERGMSLAQFVGLIAERQAISIARSQRANPFFEDPTQAETLETQLPAARDPESELASRELFHEVARRMRANLSPYALQMFELLFVQENSPEQAAAAAGMTLDAVYAWRSRLVRQVRAFSESILSENQRSLRTQGGRRHG